MNLKEMLIKHEGLRLKPYKDSVGKLTIGVGRNLDDIGITKEEAFMLLDNDIMDATSSLIHALPWVISLDEARRDVLINMTFNMGISTLLTFKQTLASIEAHDFETAAQRMKESRWADQVGPRAVELAEIMRTGG